MGDTSSHVPRDRSGTYSEYADLSWPGGTAKQHPSRTSNVPNHGTGSLWCLRRAPEPAQRRHLAPRVGRYIEGKPIPVWCSSTTRVEGRHLVGCTNHPPSFPRSVAPARSPRNARRARRALQVEIPLGTASHVCPSSVVILDYCMNVFRDWLAATRVQEAAWLPRG